jgi:hypothetical protein
MTAGREEVALAAQAQAAGEAAWTKHAADALSQHRISGSTIAVEPALTADDTAVSWSDAETSAQPSTPPPDAA